MASADDHHVAGEPTAALTTGARAQCEHARVSGRPPDFGEFSAVDRGDPGALRDYLDAVAADEAVARWKELSFDLMEPRPGAVLVDVGCGPGDDARALAARVAPGGRVIGIDASRSMIAEARSRSATGDVEFVVADAAALPLGDAEADGCRCERVLQHVDDPAAAVAEMARIVRPGGVVLAAEPDWGTLVVDGGDARTGAAVASAAMSRVRSPAVGRSLRRLFLAAGLAEVELLARTLVLTDGARAEILLGLRDSADRAVAGGLDADSAQAWVAAIDAADAEGCFTVAITSFLAHGRVDGSTS